MTFIDFGTAFRATGKGLMNDSPRGFGPDEARHNAAFFNLGVSLEHPQRRQWLWVTSIETGWELTGSYAQSLDDRTFYPRNLKQDELQINGVVANQYLYDKMVEFVQAHHQSALQTPMTQADQPFDGKPVAFRMPEHRVKNTNKPTSTQNQLIYPAFAYDGYITSFEAGHERFRFAVPWTLRFLIADDHLQKNATVTTALINATLQKHYVQHFGDKVVWSGDQKYHPAANPIGAVVDAFSDDITGLVSGASSFFDSAWNGLTDIFTNDE